MSIKGFAASVLAILPITLSQTAYAGDLGGYPEPRSYEQERSHGDYPEGGSLKDEPLPPPPRYSEYRERGPACVPRQQIRERLVGEGWRDFQDPVLRGPLAVLRARRPSGDLYVLKIDRCSGDIVGLHRDRAAVEVYAEDRGPGWRREHWGRERWGRRDHWAHDRRGWGRRYW